MEEKRIIMADIVTQMISSDQFSDEEETKIKMLIEERQRKREESRSGKCLAEVIEAEIGAKLVLDDIKMKNMCQSVYNQCFKETRVGKMDSFKLTEKLINNFQKNVRDLYGLNEKEMIFFMGMLQVGLNKMAEDGLLSFAPDKEIFHDFVNAKNRTSYIENPYSPEETCKIMKWSEAHPIDVRGLAVSLWFTGGISLTEIVNLTKKDCWGNGIMKFEKGLFETGIRPQIVRKALDQRPKDVKYVFVIPRQDKSGWKRLNEFGLQKKLWHICKIIGIEYKKIDKNQAVKL